MAPVTTRARRWATLALALIVVATGVPWTEIHAHESGHAPHSSLEHEDGHHGQDPQDGDLHVHDVGLFGHSVAASGSDQQPFGAATIAARFREPPEPAVQSSPSQLLRPPTRT